MRDSLSPPPGLPRDGYDSYAKYIYSRLSKLVASAGGGGGGAAAAASRTTSSQAASALASANPRPSGSPHLLQMHRANAGENAP